MGFKKYLENNFYDEIFNEIEYYIINNRRNMEIKNNYFTEINFIKLDDYRISKYCIENIKGDYVSLNLLIEANLEIGGYLKNNSTYYEKDNYNYLFQLNVRFLLNDGINEFKVNYVSEYQRRKLKMMYTDSFNPIISSMELDNVAEDILKLYHPLSLEKPIPLSVTDFVNNINLKIKEVKMTEDNNILGGIVFRDITIDIFEGNKLKKLEVKKGTILIDKSNNELVNIGRYNNTIIHECVHWLLHKSHNEYKYIVSLQNKINYNSSIKDLEWMEWQANSIAPRILLPKNMLRIKVNELFNKYSTLYDENNRNLMFQLIIDELSEFFKVSKLAMKIRLIQIGYYEFEGVYKYEGSEYLRSYTFEVDAIANNETFTIKFLDACFLYFTNEVFRNILDSRKYVYVDSHFCLNDTKYIIFNSNGNHCMTDEAYNNIDKCCLKFKIISKKSSRKIDFITFNEYVLNRGNTKNDEIEIDFSDYLLKPCSQNTNPEYDLRIATRISDILLNLPSSFKDSFKSHRERKNITHEKLEEVSGGVSVSTIKRLESTVGYNTRVETLVALCIGMKLYPDFSFDLFDKSTLKLNSDIPQHAAYRMLLMYRYHLSIHECNEFLEECKLKKII